MRSFFVIFSALALLIAFLNYQPDSGTKACLLTVRIETDGEEIPGIIQLLGSDGRRLEIAELVPRGIGVEADKAIHHWYVLPREMTLRVPQEKLTILGFSGLEFDQASRQLDLTGQQNQKITLDLKRFYRAKDQGWQSANTHVHLKRMGRKGADRYLVEVSEADGLDIVFVSYLERVNDDLEYTTNKYTPEDFDRLSTDRVTFDHGEEHRHNFTGFNEGYGHVMLLNLQDLILPASLGPGITGKGTDGVPLKVGIERAREQDSKVIWCHNKWGLEDVPSWLAGRLHANNIFDGGTHGSYKHSFYRYLNAGIKVPFSTGTDWFIYDFSRVYVPTDKKLSPDQWLDELSAGKSYITNGPLLEFSINEQGLGETVSLKQAGQVKVQAKALGRNDFERIELVRNGEVIRLSKSQPKAGHYEAVLELELFVEEPCWLALRTPPPTAPRDAEFSKPTPPNDYGQEIFSHTSAIFVDVAGQHVQQKVALADLKDEVLRNVELIKQHAQFANDDETQLILGVYEQAIQALDKRIESLP